MSRIAQTKKLTSAKVILLLGVLSILTAFHDYYGILKAKEGFGLIDLVLFVTGLNLLVAGYVCQKKTNNFVLLVSAIIPTALPIEITNFPVHLKVAALLLCLSPSVHILILKKNDMYHLLKRVFNQVDFAALQILKILKKIENSAFPIAFLGVLLVALYLLTSKINMHLGPDFWWHYTNTKSIYQTGFPVSDVDIFDKKFLAYPFMSHLIAAITAHLTGWPLIYTITSISYVFFLLTAVGIYVYSTQLCSRWYALITMAAFVFLYAPVTDIPAGRLAQLISTSFGVFSLVFFVKYEQKLKNKYFIASAIMAGLAFSSHWVFGSILVGAYGVHLLFRHGFKKMFNFFLVFTVVNLPYLLFLFKNIHLFFEIKPLVSGELKELIVTSNGLNTPSASLNKLIHRLTPVGLVFGVLGVSTSLRDIKKRMAISLLLTSIAFLIIGYHYPVMYFLRYFDYITLFLLLFIGVGLNKLICETCSSKNKPLTFLGMILFVSFFLVHISVHAQREVATARPVSDPDLNAILWVKENLAIHDRVTANLKLTRLVYGFTHTKTAHPTEFAKFLNTVYHNKTSNYTGFLLINQWCGIQNNKIATPDFEGDTTTFELVRDIPCENVLEKVEHNYERVFEIGRTRIFHIL